MSNFGIYSITNKINGKMYIGQTINDFEKRWGEHKRELRKNIHCNDKLQRAWNKYGEESFEFEVVHICDELDNLNRLEVYYIYKYNSFNDGYNLTVGGDGVEGCNEEERLKNLQLITQRILDKRGISIKQIENAKILLSKIDKEYSTFKAAELVSRKTCIDIETVLRIYYLNSYRNIKSELNNIIKEKLKYIAGTDEVIDLFNNTDMTLGDICKKTNLTMGQLVYRLKKNNISYSEVNKKRQREKIKRKKEKIKSQVIELYNSGERKLSVFKNKLHLTDSTIHKILDENGTSIRKTQTGNNREKNTDIKGINWDINSKRWLIKHYFNKKQYVIATEKNLDDAIKIKEECNLANSLEELINIKNKYKKECIPKKKIKIIKDGVVLGEVLGIYNASKKLGIPQKCISKCVNGKQKTTHGYSFECC